MGLAEVSPCVALFRAVAFIHDVEWHESDGADAIFRATNDRFKRNGYRMAQVEFAWWNPRHYAVMNQARHFGKYCQMFGKAGWLKCHEERLKAGETERAQWQNPPESIGTRGL